MARTTGKHLIAGTWVEGQETFDSAPVHGEPSVYADGGASHVDAAAVAADEAFAGFARTPRVDRARFLRAIAAEIEARGDGITETGASETGLPEARLIGERGRTVGQLRLFADYIEDDEYLDLRHDPALPDREPMPRPDLRLVQRPVGPVGVFGASNFPLAFSVAGGDTASALAAGCPVVVKGHPAHPGTGELVAQAIEAAIKSCDVHPGVFSMIQGSSYTLGEALVVHPLICAVGFTGSLAGGRALFDLCAQRAEPIPFFGELGSINPLFFLPDALSAKAEEMGNGWAGSLTMGVGQFCTNPGIAVVTDGPDADRFVAATIEALGSVPEQKMLTTGMADAFCAGVEKISAQKGVSELLTAAAEKGAATPSLFSVSGDDWQSNNILHEEVFGPAGIVVRVRNVAQMLEIASGLKGQLTCSVFMDQADAAAARELFNTLERKAGRLIANGYPTGVEVCAAMVHGGPYPASTNFGATSVGTMAIRRFLRPICYQDIPEEFIQVD